MAVDKKVMNTVSWDDFRLRLIADYAELNNSFPTPSVKLQMGRLDVSLDGSSLTIDGKSIPLPEGKDWTSMTAGKLISALKEGAEPCVFYEDDHSRTPYIVIRESDHPYSSCLAVVTDVNSNGFGYEPFDSFPPMFYLLDAAHSEAIVKDVLSKGSLIRAEYERQYSDAIDSIYRNVVKMERKDELVMRLSGHFILEDFPINPESAYQTTVFLSDELDSIKLDTFNEIRSFYQDMYENGALQTKEDVDVQMAFVASSLEETFSFENLLIGRLSYQVSNFGLMNGEVHDIDIARVAVWAEKDKRYAPFLDKLDRWVDSQSKYYELDPEAVNSLRVKLGGSPSLDNRRPAISDSVKAVARERFRLKV